MPLSEGVTVGFEVGQAFVDKTLFDIRPRQMYDDDIAVHCRKIGRGNRPSPLMVFKVEVGGFARPTPGVALQCLFGGAGQIRTGNVRQRGGSGTPFGKEHADCIEGLG